MQEYNVALQKHQLPLTASGRPSQRKIPKSNFHTSLDTLIVDLKSAHKKLLREGNLNLDTESDLSTRDLKAAKLVQELRNDLLELSNERKAHPNAAETSMEGEKKRRAAFNSGLHRENLTTVVETSRYSQTRVVRVKVNNMAYEDSDDEVSIRQRDLQTSTSTTATHSFALLLLVSFLATDLGRCLPR